jgi:hypothetical protein
MVSLSLCEGETKMKIPDGLAARAVLQMEHGKSFYIEIRDGTRFHDFFTTYIVHGLGRNRVIKPGSPRHRGFARDIEDAASKIASALDQNAKRTGQNKIIATKISIYRKRLYRKRLHATPDELGLTRVNCLFKIPRHPTR